MSDAQVSGTLVRKVKRPIGLWILTVADAIFAAVIPIAGIVFLFTNSEARIGLGLTGWTTLSSIVLGVGILYAVYRVWAGDAKWRRPLLLLITVHWGYIIFNNAQLLLSDAGAQLTSEQTTRLYGNMLRSFFWILWNWVYLLGRWPRNFFEQG
jgi:hypothetical protein